MSGGFFELLIMFLLLGYLDSGGPGEKYYSCPEYCDVDHKHKKIKEFVMPKGGPPGPPTTPPKVGEPVAVYSKKSKKGKSVEYADSPALALFSPNTKKSEIIVR